MALVLALAVLAAVLLAQSPLGVVLGSGLFDSPLATLVPAAPLGDGPKSLNIESVSLFSPDLLA